MGDFSECPVWSIHHALTHARSVLRLGVRRTCIHTQEIFSFSDFAFVLNRCATAAAAAMENIGAHVSIKLIDMSNPGSQCEG
jgi:hypothetical protein